MFDVLLKSKFYSKSKSGIKLTKTRIEMIKRKRNAMQKYLKNDIADLLKNGLDSNAYGRVEGLWNELNLSSCYDSVEKFCVHISSHLANMNKQRECPEECREAVSSLMFAAARFADLPELRELRAVFTERYGNSIEFYANKEFVNKLKATPPTKDMKLQLMQDIASESGFQWNSKALEPKLYTVPAPVQENKRIPKTTDDAAEKILNKGAGHEHEHSRGVIAPEKKIEGNHRSYRSYEGAENSNHFKDAPVDRLNRKEKQKHENPGGFAASEREDEDLSSRGRRERTADESNSSRKKEKAVAEGKHRSPPSNDRAEDLNDIKHVRGIRNNRKEQDNEPETLRSASGEENEEKHFYYKPFCPPYTKSRTTSAECSLAVPPTGTDAEVSGRTKTPGRFDAEEDLLCQGDPNGKVKPVPKSVRRRFRKPQPVTDQEGEKQDRQQRKGLDHGRKDDEERKLDWLLLHYSKKKSTDGGKSEPVIKPSPQEAAASNTTCRDVKDRGRDGPPTRAASLPNEQSPVETPPKGHARAASFQAENCHVHPKLPDYDDFVARLAAFRGN